MKTEIFPMGEEHLDSLAELEKICFSQPWSRQALADELENDSAFFFVAETDGEVSGYVGLMITSGQSYITNIAVFPKFRRMGIAKMLFERLFSIAEKCDLEFISLEVRPSNYNAISLYKSLGFEEIGLRKRFYRNPTEDALIMTKTFLGNIIYSNIEKAGD